MKIGRPRTLADRLCAACGKRFRPKHATTRFCSRACRDHSHRRSPAPAPVARRSYAYNGRLSDALWREIHAARAEAATAPLYRPGNVG
jgi:hypothetical protein